MMLARLSKSRYQEGLQCPKLLWLRYHRPNCADPVGVELRARFAAGHRVGEQGRRRFPGGVLVAEDHTRAPQALATTARLLNAGVSCLYEAAFEHHGVLVRVDILAREVNSWRLIEVKSGTRVRPEHITDAAIQTYVARGSGLTVDRVFLLHPAPGYEPVNPREDIEERQFVQADITSSVSAHLPSIPGTLARLRAMLAAPCPNTSPGEQCGHPYTCPFLAFCRNHRMSLDEPA